jgi:uncharacterized membrane protein (UPF0127 family)
MTRSARISRSAPVLPILVALLSLFWPIGALARGEGRLAPLQIVTQSGTHDFRVELADTPGERARGLMFRRSMPQNQGMLFDFHAETPVMMWMKNTYIPLDMVFVSRQGRVTHVATDAEPMSERVISSNGPAYAVIELNAGVARKIGLKAGDEVRHPAFSR